MDKWLARKVRLRWLCAGTRQNVVGGLDFIECSCTIIFNKVAQCTYQTPCWDIKRSRPNYIWQGKAKAIVRCERKARSQPSGSRTEVMERVNSVNRRRRRGTKWSAVVWGSSLGGLATWTVCSADSVRAGYEARTALATGAEGRSAPSIKTSAAKNFNEMAWMRRPRPACLDDSARILIEVSLKNSSIY